MAGKEKPTLDSLFGVEPASSGTITELLFDEMTDLEEHCFELYTGQRLQNMVRSIQQNGIMEPLLLWHTEGKYVLLSGYNRRNAGRISGLDRGPVRIFEDITRDEAITIMTETNLYQRSFSEMNPMEKAYCLAEHHKLIKCQGMRSDLVNIIPELVKTGYTLSDNQTKSRTDGRIGTEYNLTRDKASKYIHIGNSRLSPSLKELFRQGKLPLTQMYHLSFLEEGLQTIAAETLQSQVRKVGPSTTQKIKEIYQAGNLTEEALRSMLMAETADVKGSYTLPKETVSKYFAGQDAKAVQQIVEQALELYFARR